MRASSTNPDIINPKPSTGSSPQGSSCPRLFKNLQSGLRVRPQLSTAPIVRSVPEPYLSTVVRYLLARAGVWEVGSFGLVSDSVSNLLYQPAMNSTPLSPKRAISSVFVSTGSSPQVTGTQHSITPPAMSNEGVSLSTNSKMHTVKRGYN